MRWVLDATGVSQMFQIAQDLSDLQDQLRTGVEDGHLYFPSSVCADLKRLEQDDGVVCVFMNGVKSDRVVADPLVGSVQYAGTQVPDLVDPDDPREHCFLDVAALGHEFKIGGHDVTVVTEDFTDKTRTSLATACETLKLDVADAAEFVAEFIV